MRSMLVPASIFPDAARGKGVAIEKHLRNEWSAYNRVVELPAPGKSREALSRGLSSPFTSVRDPVPSGKRGCCVGV